MLSLQRRSDGPVLVPGRMRGRARFARTELEAPEGDALSPLGGSHRGALLSGLRIVLPPAKLPMGLRATLNAPLQAPEPALTSTLPGD